MGFGNLSGANLLNFGGGTVPAHKRISEHGAEKTIVIWKGGNIYVNPQEESQLKENPSTKHATMQWDAQL